MNSRPLLDYIAFPDYHAEAKAEDSAPADRPAVVNDASEAPALFDSLEARLKDLAARLRVNTPAPAPKPDFTLSSQIEAILRRKVSQVAPEPHAPASRETLEPATRRARLVVDPPPTVPLIAAGPSIDPEFAKFSEAVYLIGQAARRFVDEPHASAPTVRQPAPMVPSTAEIDALSAVLRETVSAFRSVADDLAVSAGEIRNIATRGERSQSVTHHVARDHRDDTSELQETVSAFRSVARELAASVSELRAASRHDDRPSPVRRDRRDRYRDDEDEIHDLRETVVDLQDRLDGLLHARRRTRY